MKNPAPAPESKRSCPTCNTQIRPYYKFCEVCGTPIQEPPACRNCGAVFNAPLLYCDVCGAPASVEDIPDARSDEAPEPDAGEIQEQEAGEIPEGEEIPAGDELPESPREEKTRLVKDKIPRSYSKEIVEPDTEEIMEKYWVDDTGGSESVHSRTTPRHEEKSRVISPARPVQRSTDTVNSALFLLDDKTAAPQKPHVNRMRIVGGGIVLVIVIAIVYFVGLPMISQNGQLNSGDIPAASTITPVPQPTSFITNASDKVPAPTKTSGPLVPKPTQILPADQPIHFQVQKSPITAKILVTFTGSASAGYNSISNADVTVTRPDGSVVTGVILPLKGINEIILDGSKEADRVEIIAKMSSGETYRVRDELVP
jgi:hypothetical protein